MQTPQKLRQARVEVDRRNALDTRVYFFAKSDDWNFQGDSPQTLAFSPVPGTWTKVPEVLTNLVSSFGKLQAFASCPKCHVVSGLLSGVTDIDELGKLTPDFRCMGHGCGFARPAHLDKWNDKVLYALSYHDRRNRMKIELHYTHADTVRQARLGIPDVADKDIIAIGPAIAFFVDEAADKTGKILVAH
jgi:hypothetical protein